MSEKNKWQADDWQRTVPKEEHQSYEAEFASRTEAEGKTEFESASPFGRHSADAEFKAGRGTAKQAPKRPPHSFKRRALKSLLLLVLAALIVTLFSSLYMVQDGEIAYINQFGRIVRTVEQSGLHLHLPFVQSVGRLTAKTMIYDVSPSEVLTADKKAMIVDSYALWRIEDSTRFIRTVGNIHEMQKRLDASVYSNIKNIMGALQQNEIISDEESTRNSLNERITAEVVREMQSYGVSVSRVEIRRYDLPIDNLAAVYNRMISERKQKAATYKADGEYEAAKIRNDTDKQCEIIIGQAQADVERLAGEAEKEYMTTLKELYGEKDKAEFYLFMLRMETLKKSLTGNKTVILGEDSSLGKILAQLETE